MVHTRHRAFGPEKKTAREVSAVTSWSAAEPRHLMLESDCDYCNSADIIVLDWSAPRTGLDGGLL
jgi:hypothetical protein